MSNQSPIDEISMPVRDVKKFPNCGRRAFLLGGIAAVAAVPARAAQHPALLDGWTFHEDRSRSDGALTITGPDNQTFVLTRFMEDYAPSGKKLYCGIDFATLSYAERDLLAEHLLAGGGDPDFIAVRDAAPPMDSHFSPEQIGRIVWTAFVAPPAADGVMPLTPAGNTRNWHVDRIAPSLGAGQPLVAQRREGLLGGALPIVVKQFPLGKGSYWEVLVFAEAEPDVPHLVPTWTRMTLVEDGQVSRVVYGDAYIPFGTLRPGPDEALFNAALVRCVKAWSSIIHAGADCVLPDADWVDFARHGFVKESMVRKDGVWPRYGAVDRDYDGSEYDGFQDIFTASLLANMEWGRFATAKAIIDNQFDHFVGDDGLVAMRGPEVGQQGLTLSLLARYLQLTGDRETLARHATRIAAMAGVLTHLHDEALALPKEKAGYGLLHGWSESDACLFPDPSIWWKPYYGNSALAVRGWKDLSSVWTQIRPGDEELASDWRRRSVMLEECLEHSLRHSVFQEYTPPYVPIMPGTKETFRQSLARHKFSEQQWAHRVFSELLQAGVLPPDLEAMTIDSMRAHGATVMGIVGNLTAPRRDGRDILGFISYGYAQALLRQERIEEYILFLYAHRAHAHTRGSWTAAEVADLQGGLDLFCLPAQMTVPILLRWALVYEDDAGETLHLARAVPRRWIVSGREISVSGMPTRWGKVSFSIRYDQVSHKIVGDLDLPENAPRDIRLHLRLPADMSLGSLSHEMAEGCCKKATFGVRIDGQALKTRRFSLAVSINHMK